jgi:hypothetical protein
MSQLDDVQQDGYHHVLKTEPSNFLTMTSWSIALSADDSSSNIFYIKYIGRATAEAVSRWLPTVVARVCAWVWQLGFVVDKVAPGQVFSE